MESERHDRQVLTHDEVRAADERDAVAGPG